MTLWAWIYYFLLHILITINSSLTDKQIKYSPLNITVFSNGEESNNFVVDLKKPDNYYRPTFFLIGNISSSSNFFLMYNLATIQDNNLEKVTPIPIIDPYDAKTKITASANRHAGISDQIRFQVITPPGVGTQFTLLVVGGGEIINYWKD